MGERWAGIVRVSHMGARRAGADNVHTDRDQVETMERRARERGATLTILTPELDVSGGLPLEQRPSLMQAILGVEAGDYDAIIVAYLSRLGRNVREQLRAWERVEAAGGHIIAVQEDLDTSTASGRFLRTVLLANAERERDEHTERFELLRQRATAAGVWQRRQTPIGYTRDRATRKLVPDEKAGSVRKAFRDRANGRPLVQIADDLTMTPSGVRYMLRNRVYLGELSVGDHVNPAAHPAIVTVNEWEDAQVTQPRPARSPRRKAEGPALLTGIAKCTGCGHAMSRNTATYTCAVRHSGTRCPSPAMVTIHLLEDHVEQITLSHLARLTTDAVSTDDGVATARAALADAKAEMTAYLEAVSAQAVGARAFAAGAQSRREAIDAAQAELQARVATRPIAPVIAGGADAWSKLDAAGRNMVLRGLLEVVLVKRAGGRGSRTPLTDRVRVIRHGAGLILPRAGGPEVPYGLHPIVLPDANDPRVLRMLES